METTQKELQLFFCNLAQKDPLLLQQLTLQSGFHQSKQGVSFYLPDLFEFLKQSNKHFLTLSYEEFRRTLFKCPINQHLKPFHANISIKDNHLKVDKSRYQLNWLDPITN